LAFSFRSLHPLPLDDASAVVATWEIIDRDARGSRTPRINPISDGDPSTGCDFFKVPFTVVIPPSLAFQLGLISAFRGAVFLPGCDVVVCIDRAAYGSVMRIARKQPTVAVLAGRFEDGVNIRFAGSLIDSFRIKPMTYH